MTIILLEAALNWQGSFPSSLRRYTAARWNREPGGLMSGSGTFLAGTQIRLEAEPPRVRGWAAGALPWVLLVVLTVLFRIPPLINAAGIANSDAAVVGLQAMHAQKGEWSAFIWGAHYQGSIEIALTAIAFAIFGPSPLTLISVTLFGYLLLILLTFDMLRRRIDPWKAFVACLVLVFAPWPVNGIALQPPRQWSITLIFAAVWMFGCATRSKLDLIWFAAGALVAATAVYGDLFVMMLLAPLVLFAITCALDTAPRPRGRVVLLRLASLAAPAIIGGSGLWLLRRGLETNKTSLTIAYLSDNANLLFGQCLPWLLGYGVYVPGAQLYPDRWHPGGGFAAIQIMSATLFASLMLISGALVFVRRIPTGVRRLGAFGIAAGLTSIVLFLISPVPTDMWSARYLCPIIWTAPFALAPIATVLRRNGFATMLAPYLLVAAVGGWVSYGPYVRGIRPVVSEQGSGAPERELASFLREHHVKTAVGHYWLAYRLAFLFREDPVMIPWYDVEDRYPPYRRRPVEAVIMHPSEPRLDVKTVEPFLRARGLRSRRFDVGKYVVLLLSRESG